MAYSCLSIKSTFSQRSTWTRATRLQILPTKTQQRNVDFSILEATAEGGVNLHLKVPRHLLHLFHTAEASVLFAWYDSGKLRFGCQCSRDSFVEDVFLTQDESKFKRSSLDPEYRPIPEAFEPWAQLWASSEQSAGYGFVSQPDDLQEPWMERTFDHHICDDSSLMVMQNNIPSAPTLLEDFPEPSCHPGFDEGPEPWAYNYVHQDGELTQTINHDFDNTLPEWYNPHGTILSTSAGIVHNSGCSPIRDTTDAPKHLPQISAVWKACQKSLSGFCRWFCSAKTISVPGVFSTEAVDTNKSLPQGIARSSDFGANPLTDFRGSCHLVEPEKPSSWDGCLSPWDWTGAPSDNHSDFVKDYWYKVSNTEAPSLRSSLDILDVRQFCQNNQIRYTITPGHQSRTHDLQKQKSPLIVRDDHATPWTRCDLRPRLFQGCSRSRVFHDHSAKKGGPWVSRHQPYDHHLSKDLIHGPDDLPMSCPDSYNADYSHHLCSANSLSHDHCLSEANRHTDYVLIDRHHIQNFGIAIATSGRQAPDMPTLSTIRADVLAVGFPTIAGAVSYNSMQAECMPDLYQHGSNDHSEAQSSTDLLVQTWPTPKNAQNMVSSVVHLPAQTDSESGSRTDASLVGCTDHLTAVRDATIPPFTTCSSRQVPQCVLYLIQQTESSLISESSTTSLRNVALSTGLPCQLMKSFQSQQTIPQRDEFCSSMSTIWAGFRLRPQHLTTLSGAVPSDNHFIFGNSRDYDNNIHLLFDIHHTAAFPQSRVQCAQRTLSQSYLWSTNNTVCSENMSQRESHQRPLLFTTFSGAVPNDNTLIFSDGRVHSDDNDLITGRCCFSATPIWSYSSLGDDASSPAVCENATLALSCQHYRPATWGTSMSTDQRLPVLQHTTINRGAVPVHRHSPFDILQVFGFCRVPDPAEALSQGPQHRTTWSGAVPKVNHQTSYSFKAYDAALLLFFDLRQTADHFQYPQRCQVDYSSMIVNSDGTETLLNYGGLERAFSPGREVRHYERQFLQRMTTYSGAVPDNVNRFHDNWNYPKMSSSSLVTNADDSSSTCFLVPETPCRYDLRPDQADRISWLIDFDAADELLHYFQRCTAYFRPADSLPDSPILESQPRAPDRKLFVPLDYDSKDANRVVQGQLHFTTFSGAVPVHNSAYYDISKGTVSFDQAGAHYSQHFQQIHVVQRADDFESSVIFETDASLTARPYVPAEAKLSEVYFGLPPRGHVHQLRPHLYRNSDILRPSNFPTVFANDTALNDDSVDSPFSGWSHAIYRGGHPAWGKCQIIHMDPNPSFDERCAAAMQDEGWLASDEALWFLRKLKDWRSDIAIGPMVQWSPSRDLHHFYDAENQLQYTNNLLNLQIFLVDAHWCAVEIDRRTDPAHVVLIQWPTTLQTTAVLEISRIMQISPSRLLVTVNDDNEVLTMCGWTIVWRWYKNFAMETCLQPMIHMTPQHQAQFDQVIRSSQHFWNRTNATRELCRFATESRQAFMAAYARNEVDTRLPPEASTTMFVGPTQEYVQEVCQTRRSPTHRERERDQLAPFNAHPTCVVD